MANSEFTTPSNTEIRFRRDFACTREQLWALWTQAEHLRNWWAPKGWHTPVCEVNLRPGGEWNYCMQGSMPGSDEEIRSCGKVIYGEIDAPRRFTGVDVFTDEAGNVNADMPQAQLAYQFEESDGGSVVINTTRYPSQEERDAVIDMGVEMGMNQTLDKLQAYIESLGWDA
ncbi:MAG: SRPBCC domain-containing protein [Chloroflexi bacterium]|nr:SRPBCC domain-containing protein [Chloroflexota bacterium]